MTNSKKLSARRVAWIREQGYYAYSDQQIRELAFGNRFAYRLCTVLLTTGIIFINIPLLVFMNVTAMMSIILPNHPFDYLYNHLIRKWTQGPKLPPRSAQLKFACTMATGVIASTIYFFLADMMIAGYLMGFQMVAVASLVSLFDLCIPSKAFNFFSKKISQIQF